MRKIFLISFIFSLISISATYNTFGSDFDLIYRNEIKKSSIHTVQIFPTGWELAPPIIELEGDNQLLFSFDEIKENIQDYSYRIIHCDKNWYNSELSEFDFLDGFAENQITDYEHSFNTNVNYIHYSLKIPNNDISLKLSGNYVIEVFEDFDPEKVVIRQRFMVLDSKVEIKGIVKHPVSIEKRESHQEVDFSIFHPNFKIDNPQLDLNVILTQNNRLDGTEKRLKPIFIRKNELVFDYEDENIFPGGNEFRNFDLKSMRYQTRYIREITSENDTTSVILSPGNNRHFKQYIFEQDINGNYLVEVQERDIPETEADYAYITFTLPMDNDLKHGDLYVHGNFNNWQCNERNKMHYDFDRGAYISKIFLKQGYYNYQFALVDHKTKIPDTGYIEGNHWETENNYIIYVYYHDIALNYDMLIGYKTIKSTARF
ncbi:hypothetical protein DF185_13990 [Marinifilum breve]|uniref:Type 9 secretion system plug protein N-terminal domain-containing protein n=1 Tax=Marinifilum breve TaxID=2184082 RepID=A0A2V3ZV80_9BACT|nr:type IX secretion system plug protein domain-containing protein [Marinifilum breve]PXX98990.1 hypothetical protein DF185_13990 [Marinifilum breve]